MTTSIDKTRFNQLIKTFQFKELFNELGWDSVRKKEQIAVENELYTLDAVAEKKGFVVFACSPNNNGKMPDYHIRKKIDSAITKLYFEHLIIFCGLSQKHQIWQLVIREQGKPTAVRETNYYVHQEPEILYQKLKGLFFSIDDEEKISIVDVKFSVQEQFNTNAEKVTKRFYDQFKKEHTSFLNFIKGVSENVDRDWYASLMLNRLMFIYFIQKKGFLDNDKDYLKNRLKATQEKRGKNKFYSFYRNFLLVLFHKGLGSSERNPEIINEIGVVPYLNGGLFDAHHIEQNYATIEIADEAFEQVFKFFDQYEWHLDTRITATGKDINPDVIGYIFEKYINDRASMGAYYTKEDITDYISKNCIIPYLFDAVKRHYPKAFNPDGEIWKLLQSDPDKYIYDAVKHGIVGNIGTVGAKHFPVQSSKCSSTLQDNNSSKRLNTPENASPLPPSLPLPPEIAEGLHDVSQRTLWNKPAPPAYALPTEIWREVVERRQRYAGIKTKIENGEIHEINDFITYNLNIRQFIQDVVENTDDPEIIKHFYKALLNISILDPTCGSGAFLFAAINILEPLYEACIQRMEAFVADANNSPLERGQRGVSKYKIFQETLATVKSPEHSNLQYFIYKNIILNNIYGVDIMHEAVEIAKLRLFLKLVATVDVDYKKPNQGLEPLPDIDFNIRAGNTLVGFARLEEVEKAMRLKLYEKEFDAIKEQAETVKMFYTAFQKVQMENDSTFRTTKRDLEERLKKLNDTLNIYIYLAQLYGVEVERKPKEFEKWKANHQPFHWFAEFYEIIHDKGGFDAIIGNPPYVEYSNIDYRISNYLTLSCGNIYAFVMERAAKLLSKNGLIGMIVPLSGHSTERMNSLVKEFYQKFTSKYVFNISADAHPSILFPGVKFRLAIFIVGNNDFGNYFTKYTKWYAEERNYLFDTLSYINNTTFSYQNILPKLSHKLHLSILNKLVNKKGSFIWDTGKFITYYHNAPVNWIRAHSFVPYFKSERDGEKSSAQLKPLKFEDKLRASAASGILCSSLFFIWWVSISDCYHLNKAEIINFPIDFNDSSLIKELSDKSEKLKNDLLSKSVRRIYNYKTSGKVEYDEFYLKKSKPIIDEIDKVLAQHYGFTDEELDFIINYDIKYRMGRDYDDNEP